jgi:hypothetical protein
MEACIQIKAPDLGMCCHSQDGSEIRPDIVKGNKMFAQPGMKPGRPEYNYSPRPLKMKSAKGLFLTSKGKIVPVLN